jgi:succinate-semialdehyde dehydrogenase / glutarate-semialdehyde dehydrogenase
MQYQTINPYTEELVQTFPLHTDGEIESIIAKAEKAYETDWGRRPLAARKAIIKKAALLLRENPNKYAELSTLEMGKLLGEARSEVAISAAILDYFADNADTFLAPEKLPVKDGEAVVESAPLGVLFCIEPWNYPYYQLARVAAPNLMLGNTVICKHAPNVPQCALAFEKLFLDAGAPAGIWTNVFATNEQSAKIVADSRIIAGSGAWR